MTQRERPPQRPAHVALPWAVGWFGVAGIGVVNGALRGLYADRMSDRSAHHVSGLTFLALYAPYVAALHRRWPLPSRRAAWLTGLAWAAGAVGLESLLGRVVLHSSWSQVAAAYDLRKGQTWPLVLGTIAAGPAVANAGPARCREDGAP